VKEITMARIVRMAGLGIVLLLAAGCASSPPPFVGTWEMVSNDGRWLDLADDPGPGGRNVKVLNATHFAFGHQQPDGTVMAGGGRYTFDDSLYVETIEYHFAPRLVGLTIGFEYRFEDDLWYHSADTEVDGVRIEIHEIWRRVEIEP
jgi:hypothetical protein